MKKTLIACCCLSAGGLFAAFLAGSAPELELAARVELASFEGIKDKASTLGTLIGNPLVPMLVQGGLQEELSKGRGALRSDGRMSWLVYIQPTAWQIASTNDVNVDVGDLYDCALVYPCVDGPATMRQKNPGSTLEDEGTVRLPAGDDRSTEQWVMFTADRKYCVFADSSALAARALADFEKKRPMASVTAPLATVEITKCGINALSTFLESSAREQQTLLKSLDSNLVRAILSFQERQQRRQLAKLKTLAGLTLDMDITSKGVCLGGRVPFDAGLPPEVFSRFCLPADAFASVPADAPLFCGLNELQGDESARGDVREFMKFLADLTAKLPSDAEKLGVPEKYVVLLRDISAAIADYAREVPLSSDTDWAMFALGFDAAKHPYFVSEAQTENAQVFKTLNQSFADKMIAALERQWPGQKMFVRTDSATEALDWGEVINVVAKETGLEDTTANRQALANAVSTLAMVLGDSKTLCRTTTVGNRIRGYMASPNVKPVAGPSTAEARLRAALPEMNRRNLTGAFYLSLYGLVRDDVLPLAAKVTPRDVAQRIQGVLGAMGPAKPNGAIACGVWFEQDGAMRFQLRVTADEVRSYGETFNALLSQGSGDSTDDE